jgi:hypothetical protein
MSQYNELYAREDAAIVLIENQPQITCESFALRAR